MPTNYFMALKDNLSRVDSLIALYSILKDSDFVSGKSREVRLTDVLRAAVVLIHGSQEDYLRSVLEEWLSKYASSSDFKEVPLTGYKKSTKYTLDCLKKFSDDSINALILRSIHDYMEQTTFNSYAEIKAWLKKAGISLTDFEREDLIQALTQRRHKIVHEVDIVHALDGTARTNQIKISQVRNWREAVESMLFIVDEQVDQWGKEIIDVDNVDLGE